MIKIFVTFSVSISKDQCGFADSCSEAEIQIARRLLYTFDPGSIFRDLTHTALTEFDSLPKPEEKEDNAAR